MPKLLVHIGPFSAFFTNVNTKMGLPGHSHFAQIRMSYLCDTVNDIGFPSFESTHRVIQDEIIRVLAKPLRGVTNEDVVLLLWETFKEFTHPEITKWGGHYRLTKLSLAVRGVPDKIGHADSFTTYEVVQ